jgi:hypothetical protein
MFAKLSSLLVAVSLLVLFPGCRKPKEATPPPTPVSATAPAQAEVQQTPTHLPAPVPQAPVPAGQFPGRPVAPAPPPAVIPAPVNGNMSATLNELSLQLRMYVGRTRTAPKSFGEFIANSGISAPEPPNGMHYAIASGQVVLQR